MDFLPTAQWRYATKRYNENKPLNPDDVQQLREVLRLSPSSINSQPWAFYFIEDPEFKKQLASHSMHNEHKINQSPLLIVFCAQRNVERFTRESKDYLEENSYAMYEQLRQQLNNDEFIQQWMTNQVYIAFGYALAACAPLQLDSTPMEGIEKDAYHELLQSGDYYPCAAISVGYRDDNDKNDPKRTPKSRRPLEEVIVNR